MSISDKIHNTVQNSGVYKPMSDVPILDQFKGTSYESVANANPWLHDYYGEPSILDKIGHFFGFRTSYDKYTTDRLTNAAKTQEQLASVQREEEYNSEAAQAERQRAAGLNPDLNGVAPSQATEMTEDGNPPDSPGAELPDVASFVMTAVNGGLDIASRLVDLNGKIVDNQGKSIANYTSIDSLAFADALYARDYKNRNPDAVEVSHYPDPFYDSKTKRSSNPRLTRMYTRRRKYYDSNPSVVDFEYTKRYRGYLDDLFGAGSTAAHPAMNGGNSNFSEVVEALQPLLKVRFDTESYRAGNEREFEDTFDGSKAASAQNAANDASKASNSNHGKLDAAFSKALSNLSKSADSGNIFAAGILLFMSIMRQDFSSKLPSLSIGK